MQVKNQKRCTIHSNLDSFIHLLDSLGADIIRYRQFKRKCNLKL